MSLQRVTIPVTSSAFLFKFAPPRPCQHLLRTFSSIHPAKMSSKRKMQTSTAYTPYTFESPPLPPRNAILPDTSIAGANSPHIPKVNDTRLPDMPQKNIRVEDKPQEIINIPERKAQSSKSTVTSTTAEPRAKPRPRTKLRARKAAMSLTASAVTQLRSLDSSPTPKLIKVGVRNRGCSGLAYHLEYVEKPGSFDELVEQDGVKVLIDSKALFSIIGSEMDWVEDQLSRRFVFRNPNIKEQCGCGESFMV